jgi:hypothetical protein
MRKFQVLALLVALSIVGVAIANADWFVIRDQFGNTAFTQDCGPGIGWTVLSGPFAFYDEAVRSSGVGGNSPYYARKLVPITFADPVICNRCCS